MFKIFPRARTANYFKARSSSRDSETDSERISSVFCSIEDALAASKTERSGLTSRINDALMRASVTLGNDSDEYLTREAQDTHYQNLLGAEIANGQRRLSQLEMNINHFQFLKTALITRFPDFKSRSGG
jgi:hypothetical protein